MPYSKTSTGYPVEMKTAVQKVIDTNQELLIDLGTEGKARNLRSRYYQFLAACKRDAEKPPVYWTEVEKKEHLAFLRGFITAEFVLEGSCLRIRPRDKAPWAQAIANAVLLDSPDAQNEQQGKLSTPESDLLKKLLAIQESKSPKGE